MYYSLMPHRNPMGFWEQENFFTSQELQQLQDLRSTVQFTDASILSDRTTSHDTDVRRARVGWLHGNETNDWVYSKIVPRILEINDIIFGFHLTDIEPFQYTQYDQDGHYGPHLDVQHPEDCLRIRKLTFTLQLSHSDSYDGGDLVIHRGPAASMLSRQQGALLVFPTYHLHQVTPVTRGTRESLVGWLHGPSWI